MTSTFLANDLQHAGRAGCVGILMHSGHLQVFTAAGSYPQWPQTKDSWPVSFVFALGLSDWGGSWANAEDSAFWTVVKAWT